MRTKLIGFTVALALFASATPAMAAGLTQPQISAIVSLLQAFGADQSVINNVSISLGGGVTTPAPWYTTFSATPTSGRAPIGVRFSLKLPTAATSAIVVDFGDGQRDNMTRQCEAEGPCSFDVFAEHTYLSPGTYTATAYAPLKNNEPCSIEVGKDCNSNGKKVIGTTVITTTGNSNFPSATVDQSSLTQHTHNLSIYGQRGATNGLVVFLSGYTYGNPDYNTLSGQLGKDSIFSTNASIAIESNGWMANFSNVPYGEYWVYVYDSVSHALLTTARLTNTGAISGAPTISALSPAQESIGTHVTITGTNITADTTIRFGSPSAWAYALCAHTSSGTCMSGTLNPNSFTSTSVSFTVPQYTSGSTCTAPNGACTTPIGIVVPGVYNVALSNRNGQSNTQTFTVTAQTPTATIDQSSLGVQAVPAFITGTATNGNSVVVSLTASSGQVYNLGSATVNNGRWSKSLWLPNSDGALSALPMGTYVVYVRDVSNNLLASGSLTIIPVN